MWQVQMEFIPGNPMIWVAQLEPTDPIYEYDNEPEAQAKANELQSQDPTGRQYRVVKIS
jgi:ribosomal protein L16/L10AE